MISNEGKGDQPDTRHGMCDLTSFTTVVKVGTIIIIIIITEEQLRL